MPNHYCDNDNRQQQKGIACHGKNAKSRSRIGASGQLEQGSEGRQRLDAVVKLQVVDNPILAQLVQGYRQYYA